MAGYSHDSRLHWYTLHSPHFHLHYHEGLEELARETLSLAESIHERLSMQLNWVPVEPVNLVLSDEYDLSNGMATPFPSNWMMLYVSPPDDLLSLEDHASWLELLLTHEYTHILHLDKAKSLPDSLRSVFGRNPLFFPNLFQPRWMIEGYATYIETDDERGIGRGQSSMYEAMMRTEVLSGIKPLSQVNQPMATWPAGTTAYLYGVNFYQFLQDTRGADTVDVLIENYSDNLLPFFINTNAKQIYGKDLSALWDDFEIYLNQKYQPHIEAICNKGLVEGQRLTTDGYFTGPLRALPDGRAYYISYNGVEHAGLMMIDSQGEVHQLREVNFGARLDVHPQAGVLLLQPELCHNASIFYDIYRLDFDGGELEQLTDCARYRNASWSADGHEIIAVRNSAGKNELHLLDPDGKVKNILWTGKPWEVIGAFDASPDGEELVASVWRPETGWNLESFNLKNKTWRMLTSDIAIEGYPQYLPDGHSVVFTSDHDGVYNIRRMDLNTTETFTLTNVLTGAVSPAMVDNGDLYYLGYTADGLDVFKLDAAQQGNELMLVADSGTSGRSVPQPDVFATGPAEPYSPWNSLQPRWWLPHLFIDDAHNEIGIVTGGSDSLLQQLYAIDVAYDIKNDLLMGSLQYVYDVWYPLLKFDVERQHDITLDTFKIRQRVRRTTTQKMEVVFPLLSMNDKWSFNIGAFKLRSEDVWWRTGLLPDDTYTDNVLGLALLYDSTERHIKSISRTSGRDLNLVVEDSDEIAGSDYSGRVYLGDWREFLQIDGEQVLALRYVEAKGTATTRSFSLGGFENDSNSMNNILAPVFASPFNHRQFSLRGYPEGLPQLSGQRMRLGTIEYRLPVSRIERGIMSPPVGIDQLYVSIFYETGSAWNSGSNPQEYYRSTGIEFNVDTVLFYVLPVQMSMGYAKGLDLGGERQWYLRIGAAF
ncbi:MAG: hypothetical protein OEY66_12345 [Gammaproteobacteria bacterium]|nr:hypothetical protein [Gammaproteobacteria bacterium]